MIVPVGAWALRQAVRDRADWCRHHADVPRVSVNLSAIQLGDPSFVDAARQALAPDGAAPGSAGIDFEVTESHVMENVHEHVAQLEALRACGANLAIDDFGTGYSSLAYLARLPVQTLKIDQSFVQTMLDEPSTMTLVQTMISLAHSLRLRVVAEGVETEDQAKILRLLRCDEMQGFLISQAVPGPAVAGLLVTGLP
jgi:EAL domain-containing protein (putative c-di-GMP-specific phosphodiesterase class I)